MSEKTPVIRDRIKEVRTVKASELIPNPDNWRNHPPEQRRAMEAAFRAHGNVDFLKVVETDDGLMLVDGHLRDEILGEQDVRVAVLDMDAQEAKQVLATFDPLALAAEVDQERLAILLAEIELEEMELERIASSLIMQIETTEPEFPDLSGQDKGIKQMTFVLSLDQADIIDEGLKKARSQFPCTSDDNENRNGNALFEIVKKYVQS